MKHNVPLARVPPQPRSQEPLQSRLRPELPPALPRRLSPEALALVTGRIGAQRTVDFLAARLQSPHTRRAYGRAIRRFAAWCAEQGLQLRELRSLHVSAYLEQRLQRCSPPSAKVELAALRHWMDWLVVGHVLLFNPAHAVRGPRYSLTQGKTPVLEAAEARRLLESIDARHLVGLRDRALLSVMLFGFARVGAAVKMRVRDYERPGSPQAAFVLHEKRGRRHRIPAHHRAAAAVDALFERAELEGAPLQPEAPLFQSSRGQSRTLTGRALSTSDALRMVKRRCREAGLSAGICNHSLRATAITLHQLAGGELEAARQLAGHASLQTTQLYDRSGDKRRRSEVERVQI